MSAEVCISGGNPRKREEGIVKSGRKRPVHSNRGKETVEMTVAKVKTKNSNSLIEYRSVQRASCGEAYKVV